MSNGAKIAALAPVLSFILACWCMCAGKWDNVGHYGHQSALYGYITYILMKIES
jgi:hypothetical protein